jgi:hypothetical protein
VRRSWQWTWVHLTARSYRLAAIALASRPTVCRSARRLTVLSYCNLAGFRVSVKFGNSIMAFSVYIFLRSLASAVLNLEPESCYCVPPGSDCCSGRACEIDCKFRNTNVPVELSLFSIPSAPYPLPTCQVETCTLSLENHEAPSLIVRLALPTVLHTTPPNISPSRCPPLQPESRNLSRRSPR